MGFGTAHQSDAQTHGGASVRGQISLPALALAFLLLTGGLVVAISVAGSALDAANRPALDRQGAVALSERLVEPDAPVTTRENVLDASKLSTLNDTDLREEYGITEDVSVRIRVDGEVVATVGSPDGGVTIERLVLVEHRQTRTIEPGLGWSRRLTLPRRTSTVRVTVQPPTNTTVRGIRVDGRTRLWNASGLRGSFELPVSQAQVPTLRLNATGSLPRGSLRVEYYPTRTEKVRMAVTLDG